MVIALASEIELFFRFGLSERLRYVWRVLAEHSLEAKDVFDYRYADRL